MAAVERKEKRRAEWSRERSARGIPSGPSSASEQIAAMRLLRLDEILRLFAFLRVCFSLSSMCVSSANESMSTNSSQWHGETLPDGKSECPAHEWTTTHLHSQRRRTAELGGKKPKMNSAAFLVGRTARRRNNRADGQVNWRNERQQAYDSKRTRTGTDRKQGYFAGWRDGGERYSIQCEPNGPLVAVECSVRVACPP